MSKRKGANSPKMREKREGRKGKIPLKNFLKKALATVLGAFSGGVNVLFGGGGGMLVVPALRYGLGIEEKRAHASAIAVMLPLSTVSAAIYTMRGVWDVRLGLLVGCGAVLGGAMGALLLKKVPKTALSLLFYGVMIYAGVKFLK